LPTIESQSRVGKKKTAVRPPHAVNNLSRLKKKKKKKKRSSEKGKRTSPSESYKTGGEW